MRTVLFMNNATAIALFSWTVPNDIVIRGVAGSNGNMHITTDPALTVALYQTPTELISVPKDVLIVVAGTQTPSPVMNIPVSAGKTLFAHFSASKGSMVLFIDDVLPS
jgi:hypothetical protein